MTSRLKIVNDNKDLWSELNGKKFFLTGGTGFFGKSFLDLILYIQEQKKLTLKFEF